METYQLIALAGLFFDIVGAFILFRFGIPPKEITNGFWESPGEEPQRRFSQISRYGLVLLILGFVLQFISILINSF